jgi:hypothetical protein
MKRKKFLIEKLREILFYNESQLKQLLISNIFVLCEKFNKLNKFN